MHKCAKIGYIFERPRKYQIKPHISRIHNNINKHESLNCPYCPRNFKGLQTLNRHLYIDKVCKAIKLTILNNTINWKQVWNDICNRNNYNE